MTHPAHELNQHKMADRLAYFLYSNREHSDWMKYAGDRRWITICKQAGETVKREHGKEVGPSAETRELTISKLQDLEDSGAARGPSLAEITGFAQDAGARDDSSWGAPAPVTVSDGSLRPGPETSNPTPDVSPSDISEAPAPPTAGNSEGQTVSTASPLVASEDVCPPARSGLSDSQRGGQASLLPPHQKHSETSVAAARGIKHETARLRLAVLNLLREKGPLTDEEIADLLQLPQNTARPRRVELMRAGSVEKVGKRVTRAGRRATTWGASDVAVSA